MGLFGRLSRQREGAASMTLTEIDMALLALFIRQEGKTLGTEYISERAFCAPETDGGTSVRTHIAALQKKLEGSGSSIAETQVIYDEVNSSVEYIFTKTPA